MPGREGEVLAEPYLVGCVKRLRWDPDCGNSVPWTLPENGRVLYGHSFTIPLKLDRKVKPGLPGRQMGRHRKHELVGRVNRRRRWFASDVRGCHVLHRQAAELGRSRAPVRDVERT